jgi:cytochrome c oxidase subunit 3
VDREQPLAPAHQFDSLEQQREAATLGMWVFLATEIMFFGGLFLAYAVYRGDYPQVFAISSNQLDIKLGTINTIVLICSSLTMALAVYSSEIGNRGLIIIFLMLTIILGLIFLGIKGYEYHQKYVEHLIPNHDFKFPDAPRFAQQAQLFFSLYFIMTGLHALHMIVGIGIVSVIIALTWLGKFSRQNNAAYENIGLYWHFVDIIWIFLYPLLYLAGRHLH